MERMNALRWERLKAVFAEAIQCDTTIARAAFVRDALADDATLREEAESLLAQARLLLQEADDPFEQCADEAAIALRRHDPSQVGRRIGAYEIRREIGRGGMGTVYLAERADGQFQKQVAIKLLKRGTDTDEVLRRFSAERHILARLEHPNIARLLDSGTTDDGLPYFVMEHVQGEPVTRFLLHHPLSVTERLRLFLKICSAVEAAHQLRIIHRDLKPKNILVTEQGEPKLLDFGIAKLLEPGALENTAIDQQHFTPLFASPEQARGDALTCASDVYALGALLYEILTSQPPYQFAHSHPSRAEILRVISEQEPTPPSTMAKSRLTRAQLRGDLDTIVLFAMRKEPSYRYPSVTEFAADLERYLDCRPLRARRNTLVYRTRRFLSRNRATAIPWAWAAAAFCLLLGATGFLLRSNPGMRRFIGVPAPEPAKVIVSQDIKAIVVQPFPNANATKENAFFSGGVQDDILTALSKFSDLKVIPGPSPTSYVTSTPRSVPPMEREPVVANNLESSLPQLSVLVSDSTGKTAYKGVTDGKGVFATAALSPGQYVVQFTSKRGVEMKGNSFTLVVSAGKKKVVAGSVAGEKFSGGGVAMKVEVGAGANVSGQVTNATTTKSDKDGRKMVWIAPRLGSNLPGHWAAPDSAEAKEAMTQTSISRQDLQDRQDGNNQPMARFP